jgi:hypothetical protein
MRREGVIGPEEFNVTAPMKPGLTSTIGLVGLPLLVRRKLLLYLGCSVSSILESRELLQEKVATAWFGHRYHHIES